jgi:hypothetical protein
MGPATSIFVYTYVAYSQPGISRLLDYLPRQPSVSNLTPFGLAWIANSVPTSYLSAFANPLSVWEIKIPKRAVSNINAYDLEIHLVSEAGK